MWRITGASRQGTSHIDRGQPCQDAHLAESFEAPDGSLVLVVVVSDGAGSAPHSERGSRLVCDTIHGSVTRAIREGLTPGTASVDHVRAWIKDALDAVILQAEVMGVRPRDLAATCLGMVAWSDRAIGWQLGDGAVVLDDGSGGVEVLVWPQRGEYANETSFLVEAADLASLSVVAVDRPVHRVAALSDGIQMVALEYVTKSASVGFFAPMFDAMDGAQPGRHAAVDAAFSEMLDRRIFLDRTDDDRTLVLAVRPVPQRPVPVTAGALPIPPAGQIASADAKPTEPVDVMPAPPPKPNEPKPIDVLVEPTIGAGPTPS